MRDACPSGLLVFVRVRAKEPANATAGPRRQPGELRIGGVSPINERHALEEVGHGVKVMRKRDKNMRNHLKEVGFE